MMEEVAKCTGTLHDMLGVSVSVIKSQHGFWVRFTDDYGGIVDFQVEDGNLQNILTRKGIKRAGTFSEVKQ